jgi:hypothetical protein
MKPVFQALVAIIAIAAIGALVISFSIDKKMESNLEKISSEMLDTTVNVEEASVSILDGKGSIEGVTIQNPAEFSEKTAIKLQEIKLKVDVYSLFSDTIVIEQIDIPKPEVYVEQKNESNNIAAFLKKIENPSAEGIKLIVDHLKVGNGLVYFKNTKGENLQADLNGFELKDGDRKNSIAVQQSLQKILNPILESALQTIDEQNGLLQREEENKGDSED